MTSFSPLTPTLFHPSPLFSSPPLNLPPSAGMSDNTTFPVYHHLPFDHSAPSLFQHTHPGGMDELSDSGASTSLATTDFPFDAHHAGQDPHRPGTLAEPIGWDTTTTQTPRVANPSPQVIVEDMSTFDAVSAAYSAYPVGPHTPALSSRFSYYTLERVH